MVGDRGRASAIKGVDTLGLLAAFTLNAGARLNGARAMLLAWGTLVRDLRWHWEKGLPIPGVSAQVRTTECLVSQKIEMLQACITAKIAARERPEQPRRDSGEPGASEGAGGKRTGPETPGGDGDEEVFVDASEGPATPEGRLEPLGFELLYAGGAAFLPAVLPQVQMTEDAMAERLELLAALGTTPEGQQKRAEMQSASLSSDMQAFKAANPSCALEDFVRWHSPKDLVADATSPGGYRLSDRMSEFNLWRELWEAAEPVPACRQPPLFDHVGDAEKVLHYLEVMRPEEILAQLSCAAVTAAAEALRVGAGASGCPRALARVREMDRVLDDTFAETHGAVPAEFARPVAAEIAACELRVATSLSVSSKVRGSGASAAPAAGAGAGEPSGNAGKPGARPRDHTKRYEALRTALCRGGEVEVKTPAEREAVLELFDGAMREADIHSKEFILAHGHNRLYARIDQQEFRLALVTK